jgi:hypothetical protein
LNLKLASRGHSATGISNGRILNGRQNQLVSVRRRTQSRPFQTQIQALGRSSLFISEFPTTACGLLFPFIPQYDSFRMKLSNVIPPAVVCLALSCFSFHNLLHSLDLRATVVDGPGKKTEFTPLTKHDEPTIYFVLTAALNKSPKRCRQYARSIQILMNETKQMLTHKSYRIVYVEGNGRRTTCLENDFGVEILYTNNSGVITGGNYGTNELLDVTDAISYFDMKDTDLLVKMTGRYYLDHHSPFLSILNEMNFHEARALVKFGSYMKPSNQPMMDCISGLIMLPVSSIPVIWQYWNQLSNKKDNCIEWQWAAAALALPPSQVVPIQGTMGIYISPGEDDNFRLV